MLTQKDQKTIRSKLDNIYKILLSKKDIDYFENEIVQIIQQFNKSGDFGILVNIATIISFLVAPVIAVFNHYLVNNTIEDEYKPAIWLKILSYLGITYLIGFSIFFLIYTFM